MSEQQLEAKPKKGSKEVAKQEEAPQEEEGPSYKDFEFPEDDADLSADGSWTPVRPTHNSMAKMLSGSDGIGYAVRTYEGEDVSDNVLSDEEFSEIWVPVPPAKLD